MSNFIAAPRGFCFDMVVCGDDPIIDDPESEDYNVDSMVQNFVNQANSYASAYTTNHIMYPMG